MTKKVLGFKEKDFKKEIGKPYYPDFYVVDESKLVPVVSLEWLEKYCDKDKKIEFETLDYEIGYNTALESLKQAVKKEVGK